MAEIHVEKKSKKPIWPWLVAILLVIVAIVWWLFGSTQVVDYNEINMIEPSWYESLNSAAHGLYPKQETPNFFELN